MAGKRAKSKQSNLPLVVGAVLLTALVVSSVAVVALYSHELKQSFAAGEKHFEARMRHLSARQPNSNLDNNDRAAADVLTDQAAQLAATPKMSDQEKGAKVQQRPAAAAVADALRSRAATASGANKISWKKHVGKSCQNYVEDEGNIVERSLQDSKAACLTMESCVAIVCPRGREIYCTLRAAANFVDYRPEDCYEQIEMNQAGGIVYNAARVHPAYNDLLKEYCFQQVATQHGNQVNILLVRSQPNDVQQRLYHKYKNDILFLGISSMNDYPLKDEGSADQTDYLGMFPGFLHMMREPEKVFPPHVKTLLMSQSDFSLPDVPARDYSVPKKYDFTYSASDCDVEIDGKGWCGWSKNWTFVKEALGMMCGELKLTGVLVATKNKANTKAYSIPDSCKGRMIQTTYLAQQQDYFDYLKQSRFAFLPQIHDASPRVSSQALAHDVPILMNYYIKGGWKYVTEQTGEFFHDMSDFRESLLKILKGADEPHHYEPRKWALEKLGSRNSGERLLKFVEENFANRVKLPKGTRYLQI